MPIREKADLILPHVPDTFFSAADEVYTDVMKYALQVRHAPDSLTPERRSLDSRPLTTCQRRA
jgi:hypothetical protein